MPHGGQTRDPSTHNLPNNYCIDVFDCSRYVIFSHRLVKYVIQFIKKYREYVYSVALYKKYLTRFGELIIFEPWRQNYHLSQPS